MSSYRLADDSAIFETDNFIDQRSNGSTGGVRLMSLTDVADQLDVSLSTLRRRITEGALRVHRIGRAIRISHVDLAAFLAATRSKKP